ncbi:vegetative incompatibility protein HET-E-1 [Rhizoctonia solani 123E]|uniref:Vegetative incompatibility protein HET-E-1 n=1 Tax=Rhizoctonia solani 123E TaxID=1423351 RepID=A0A074RRB6_9AGAM|nr:vegetative incompatibility protein HET-E-1 [Rhizoctonia solani 123E]
MDPDESDSKQEQSDPAPSDGWLHPRDRGELRGSKKARSTSGSRSLSSSGTSTPSETGTNESTRASRSSRSLKLLPQSREPNRDTKPSSAQSPTVPQNPEIADVTTPIQDPASTARSGLEEAFQTLRVVADTSCPPLCSVIDDLTACLHVFEATAKNRQEYNGLTNELKSLVEQLIQHLHVAPSEVITYSISTISEAIRKEIGFIGVPQSRGGVRQVLDASGNDEDLRRRYRRIIQLFQQVLGEASMGTWGRIDEHFMLERLRPAKLAMFDSRLSTEIGRRTCTENTRTKILEGSLKWSEDPDGAKIYWMNGMAGTGKTTIATTFCDTLEARKQLAASFFCTRTSPECREAKRIVPTIAYQFSRRSAPFRSALYEASNEDPDSSTGNISTQFESLIRRPLMGVQDKLPDNLVVVIDALDECTDPHIVKIFLDLLFRSISYLPIKFYVTGRPVPVIRNKMMSEREHTRSILYLHEIEKSLVQADIKLYLKEELEFMTPAEFEIKKLAEHADNLFIYAATAVRYIGSTNRPTNSHARLSTILAAYPESKNTLSGLDVIYSAILTAAIDHEELIHQEQDEIRLVLWTAICACEPVLTSTLSALCGLDEHTTMAALESLRSILHVSDRSKLVTALHVSFPNYMFSLERSGGFFCDKAAHNQFLAQQCFDIMKSQLRFNIGDIKSSFIPDSEIPDLGESIVANISDELFYACRFWADHLSRQYRHRSSALLPEIYKFLSQQLLFWMEVLCLKQVIHIGPNLLLKTSQWIYSRSHSSPELASLFDDAHDFLKDFALSPASESTPNIYVTSVRLCSKSAVYACYSKYAQGWPDLNFCGRVTEYRTLAVSVVPNHKWSIGSGALSISYSPDGTRVVVGCEDGTISIYNSSDDSLLIGPLCEHTGWVRCVIFSPDGAYILSASSDCTIKLWDASNGVPTAAVFQGHTYPVKSVAFSSDGKRIVSGSWDNTVRLWNASDGSSIMDPLEGHKWGVNCVAFSPDDTFVASGASDYTVRLWHLHHNTPTSIAFEGHSGPVTSLAFTPNGSRLISGSADCSIGIWSIPDGSLVTHLLQGCAHSINSIAVSPDGAYFSSGSVDIRIWEIDTGRPVAIIRPLTEHTYSVRSAVFSPDGSRVLSCSHEKTIMLWDLQCKTRPVSDPCLPDQAASTALTEKAATGVHVSPAPTPNSSQQPTVRIWTVRQEGLSSLSSQRFARTNIVTSFAWSHDGLHSASCPHFYQERVANRAFVPDPDHMCLLVNSKDNNLSGTNGSRAAHYSPKLIDRGIRLVEDDTEPNESALRKLLRPFELRLSKMTG